MNKLFFGILTALIAASIYTYFKLPAQETERTVLNWCSDACPQRYEQLEIFAEWMRKKHPEVKLKANGKPAFEVELYSSNNQGMLIQAVSGVAGDLLDHGPIPTYAGMGLLLDITEDAQKHGYSLSETYPGAAGLLSYNGRQYGHPCNLYALSMWVNLDTFAKYDLPVPRENWTIEEFEQLGKLFNAKVNHGKRIRTQFLMPPLGFDFATVYARSLGADSYNETLTHSNLADPRFVEALKLIYKWTYMDRILPTGAEVASNDIEAGGYGGASLAHFIHGNYAMMITGRYSLMRCRELDEQDRPRISSVLYPQAGFKNAIIGARSTGIYAGSKHPEEAKYFMEYLASREYNDTIIRGTDGLPPNPKYAIGNPEYLAPKEYPNEGNIHANELRWAMELAVPVTACPFYKSTGTDWSSFALSKVMADRATPEAALLEAQKRIDKSIRDTVAANDRLGKMYQEAFERQKDIDACKATWKYDKNNPNKVISGDKIPASLISNPYYLRYYKSIGMLKEEE